MDGSIQFSLSLKFCNLSFLKVFKGILAVVLGKMFLLVVLLNSRFFGSLSSSEIFNAEISRWEGGGNFPILDKIRLSQNILILCCYNEKCFFSSLPFQAVMGTNGTTALLHTEHIWYPRIREVTCRVYLIHHFPFSEQLTFRHPAIPELLKWSHSFLAALCMRLFLQFHCADF